jgi:hemoglobin
VNEDAAPAAPGPAAPATPFGRLGGESGVRTLVDRFYDLMDLEPRFAGLRALHPTALDGSRDKLHWFLCGWLGGPNHYIERFGHPRLRARHLPYAIGADERDQWMACMQQAMLETGVEPLLAARLAEAFFGTADWMVNVRSPAGAR